MGIYRCVVEKMYKLGIEIEQHSKQRMRFRFLRIHTRTYEVVRPPFYLLLAC